MGKLNALNVKRATEAGMYGDGAGLWLQVTKHGGKSWSFRFMLRGRSREMGLGSLETTGLALARELAQDARRLLREGKDPIEARRAKIGSRLTFQEVAIKYIDAHKEAWKGNKSLTQWSNSLETYVFPRIGQCPIGKVEVTDVMHILEPLWRDKTETASRIRSRIELIIDYATARGWSEGDNPARWKGHLESLLPAKDKMASKVHFEALPWKEIQGFMTKLRQVDTNSARGLEFLILTAARASNVLALPWSEIDMKERLWTIPSERMKNGSSHRVPLSTSAMTLLENQHQKKWGTMVFPGRFINKPLGDQAFLRLTEGVTVHGFRSTFRDWVSDTTNHQSEIAEAALAHTIRNKAEAAYRRGDQLEKRRLLMQDWDDFIQGKPISHMK